MNKTVRNSLIIIAITIVAFGIIWLVYDMVKKEPVDANISDTNLPDENTGLDNIINELFDNVMVNETIGENNTIENNTADDEKEKESTKNTVENESVTSKEKKAIELVKKEWGGEDGVYFSNESIDASGRYIVSVRDKRTTNSLAFFIVDIEKELVTKQ